MTAEIKLLIVDDHALFRQILSQALTHHPRLRVVGEAATLEEALTAVQRLAPDVVLMDLRLRGEDGVEATRRLTAEAPGVAVIALTVSEDEQDLIAALQAGAKGYVLKTDDYALLVRSVEAVAAGQALVSPEMVPKLLQRLEALPGNRAAARSAFPAELTEREESIADLVAEGQSNRQIGERLCLSESTVRSYLTAILSKLGLQNRTQLAMYALQRAAQ